MRNTNDTLVRMKEGQTGLKSEIVIQIHAKRVMMQYRIEISFQRIDTTNSEPIGFFAQSIV